MHVTANHPSLPSRSVRSLSASREAQRAANPGLNGVSVAELRRADLKVRKPRCGGVVSSPIGRIHSGIRWIRRCIRQRRPVAGLHPSVCRCQHRCPSRLRRDQPGGSKCRCTELPAAEGCSLPPFTRVVDRGRPCKGRYLRGCTRARIGAAATTVNGVARGKSSSSDVMRACRTIVANARVASSMAK